MQGFDGILRLGTAIPATPARHDRPGQGARRLPSPIAGHMRGAGLRRSLIATAQGSQPKACAGAPGFTALRPRSGAWDQASGSRAAGCGSAPLVVACGEGRQLQCRRVSMEFRPWREAGLCPSSAGRAADLPARWSRQNRPQQRREADPADHPDLQSRANSLSAGGGTPS